MSTKAGQIYDDVHCVLAVDENAVLPVQLKMYTNRLNDSTNKQPENQNHIFQPHADVKISEPERIHVVLSPDKESTAKVQLRLYGTRLDQPRHEPEQDLAAGSPPVEPAAVTKTQAEGNNRPELIQSPPTLLRTKSLPLEFETLLTHDHPPPRNKPAIAADRSVGLPRPPPVSRYEVASVAPPLRIVDEAAVHASTQVLPIEEKHIAPIAPAEIQNDDGKRVKDNAQLNRTQSQISKQKLKNVNKKPQAFMILCSTVGLGSLGATAILLIKNADKKSLEKTQKSIDLKQLGTINHDYIFGKSNGGKLIAESPPVW